MSRENKIFTVIVLAIAVGLLGYAAYLLMAGDDSGTEAALISFVGNKEELVAEGRGLEKVEVWAIPTGTGITEESFTKIGEMAFRGKNERNLEVWILPTPPDPILATEIFARAYRDGSQIGQISLAERGATELYNVLWGKISTTKMQLRVGETKAFEDLEITLVRVANDSRCPVDAVCVQVGSARAEITRQAALLSSDTVPYQFKNYYITLEHVAPEPHSAVTIAQGEYLLTFALTKDERG
jgi:hypothetical protein